MVRMFDYSTCCSLCAKCLIDYLVIVLHNVCVRLWGEIQRESSQRSHYYKPGYDWTGKINKNKVCVLD